MTLTESTTCPADWRPQPCGIRSSQPILDLDQSFRPELAQTAEFKAKSEERCLPFSGLDAHDPSYLRFDCMIWQKNGGKKQPK
jgi:hypothetical protein